MTAPAAKVKAEAERLAEVLSRAAVGPLEGCELQFDAALEMATPNVARRLVSILDRALREAEQRGFDAGFKRGVILRHFGLSEEPR